MVSLKIFRTNSFENVYIILQFQEGFPDNLRNNYSKQHFGWHVKSSVCPAINIPEHEFCLPGKVPSEDSILIIENFPSIPPALDYVETIIKLVRAVNRDLSPDYTPSINTTTVPYTNVKNYPLCFLVS